MFHKRSRWIRLVTLIGLFCSYGLGALVSVQCGSTTSSSATTSAPTVSIPAPIVTKITISVPVSGISTITGTEGAVTGGNTVQAINLTQTGSASWWEPLLWGIAYAATTNSTTANADGSFTMEITAALGDQIKVSQFDNDGNESTATTFVAPFVPLQLGYTPLDIAVDPDSNTAYILGISDSLGIVTPLTLGDVPAFGTAMTLPSDCDTPTALDVDATNDQLIIIDNASLAICKQPQNGSAGSLITTLTVAPINIAIHQSAGVAVITNDSDSIDDGFVIEVTFLNLSAETTVGAIVTELTSNHTATSSVAVATINSMNIALVVMTTDDGNETAFLFQIGTPSPLGSGSILTLTASPKEVRISDSGNGILVDNGGFVHILSLDPTSGSVSLTDSVALSGDGATGVVVDDTTNHAYVAVSETNAIDVIDLTEGSTSRLRSISVAGNPTHLIFKNSTLNQLGIIHTHANDVVVISP